MLFKSLYGALTRFGTKWLAPTVGGAAAVSLEWALGGIQWGIIKVCDLISLVIAGLLGLIPFPVITFSMNDISAEAVDLIAVLGVAPAMATFVTVSVIVMVVRLIPFVKV